MTFYFGGGIKSDSDPGTAFAEGYKKSKLGRLLSDAYNAPEESKRGLLAQLMAVDAEGGLAAAKVLDPALRNAQQGTPAQQQYAEWLLKNAPPEHRDQVLGVLGGYKARPSGAAIQYKDGEDEYGNPIVRAFDPNNVGGQVMGTGQTYGAPVGTGQRMGGMPPQAPQQAPQSAPPPMAGGQMFAGLGQIPGVQVTSGLRTPEHNARVGGVPNSYHLTGQARDIAPPRSQEQAQQIRQYAAQNGLEIIDEGDHWHLEPRSRNAQPQQQPANGFIGRRKEEEAAAVERAKEGVQIENLPVRGQIEARNAGLTEATKQGVTIGNLPRVGALEADNAGMKESATTQARLMAERQGKRANESLDATETIGLLGGAEELLKRASGGMLESGRDKLLGAFNQTTEGSRATAGLKILAAKLIQKVPRFEGPQSNIDVQSYREAAGDLANDALPVGARLAALREMRRLAQKAASRTRPQAQGGGWKIEVVQ